MYKSPWRITARNKIFAKRFYDGFGKKKRQGSKLPAPSPFSIILIMLKLIRSGEHQTKGSVFR